MNLPVLAKREITAAVIEAWLEQHESSDLEFKAARDDFSSDSLCKYCCGIANAGGGYLVLGVTDKLPRQVVGTSASNKPADDEKMVHDRVGPGLRVDVVVQRVRGQKVVVVIIPSRLRGAPYKFEGIYYTRIGDQLKEMSTDELKQIFAEDQGSWLEVPAVRDVLPERVANLLDLASFYRMREERAAPVDKALEDLKRAKLVAAAPKHGRYHITRMGVLLLAHSIEECAPELAHKRVRLTKYKGSGKAGAILCDEEWDKGWAVGFDEMMRFAFNQMDNQQVIRGVFRKHDDFTPEVALRELLANAIIHQDFTRNGRASIEIFSNRISITNPGAPPLKKSEMIRKFKTPNPSLMRIMRLLNLSEERGTGIDKAILAIEAAGTAPIEYVVDSDLTEAIMREPLPYEELAGSQKELACLQHCEVCFINNDYMSNESLRDRFKVDDSKTLEVTRLIKRMIAKGSIKRFEGNGNSKKYTRYVPVRHGTSTANEWAESQQHHSASKPNSSTIASPSTRRRQASTGASGRRRRVPQQQPPAAKTSMTPRS